MHTNKLEVHCQSLAWKLNAHVWAHALWWEPSKNAKNRYEASFGGKF